MNYARLFILLLLAGCNSSDPTSKPYGTKPPKVEEPVEAKGSVVLYWVAPVAYTDQTRIEKLSGFKIYVSKSYEDIANKKSLPVLVGGESVSTLVEGLDYDTYYFGITAVDDLGTEGEMSEIISAKVNSNQPVQAVNCAPEWQQGSYVMVCT